jgi:hypothetical protein
MIPHYVVIAVKSRSKYGTTGEGTFINIPVVLLDVLDPFASLGKLSFWCFAVFFETNVRSEVPVYMFP